jgi:3-hydroxyacyl-[acyl-carrier-protein] dehydratase
VNEGGSAARSAEIGQILALIPHRYPLVLVDRVLHCVPMQSSHAIKNVSRNEPFFEGVDSRHSRMPQMLVVEAMAQNCALLCSLSIARPAGSTYFFAGIDNCSFGTGVRPGDQLHLEATILRLSAVFGRFHARAHVAGNMVAEADFIAVVAQSGRGSG